MTTSQARSARRDELLELAYRYVLEHGLVDMSLRPLAAAVGSSPRVLLYLFGSKDGLLRALLARAREEELEMLDRLRDVGGDDLPTIAREVWYWLAAEEHEALLKLWVEGYGRSLVEPDGAWAQYARATVEDWLALLASGQPPDVRSTRAGEEQRTFVLAVLRGALLDLLATGERERAGAAVERALSLI